MRLRWLRGARTDVRRIGRYIAQDSPNAAERITTRIVEAIDLLTDQPGMGEISWELFAETTLRVRATRCGVFRPLL